jgi:hypothetical protein
MNTDPNKIDEIASGNYQYDEKHGKVLQSGFGGSQWYQFEDGTVKTYLELLSEKGNPLLR